MKAAVTDWRKLGVRGILILAFWTLIALSFAGQFYIASFQLGRPVAWTQALFHSLADWYVFAVMSALPVLLSRRFRLDGPAWGGRLGIHFAASIVFSLLYVVVRAAVGYGQARLAGQWLDYQEAMRSLLWKTWHFNWLIYWVILTVSHALHFYRRYEERAARSAELEKRLVEARLMALQMQLNPHFLFNTLHAISALMHRDVDAADRMLARLSDLLRRALESTQRQEVPLAQEIEFLRDYLDIEQTRFGPRLKIHLDIAPETTHLHVPNLILQPLVENAIQYGIEPHSQPGSVTISAKIIDSRLRLCVTDTGGKTDAPRPPIQAGIGLNNVQARLAQLFGEQHNFQVDYKHEGGVEAVISIPARQNPQLKPEAPSRNSP